MVLPTVRPTIDKGADQNTVLNKVYPAPQTRHMQGTVRIDDKTDIVVYGINVVVRLNEEVCCAAGNKDQNYEKSDK